MLLPWLNAALADSSLPRQRALVEALRRGMHDGRLPAGARLPSSRALAQELNIARNTVLYAYEQLLAEGYLQADRQGTRVADLPAPPQASSHDLPALSRRAEAIPASPAIDDAGALPFALGGIALEAFPLRQWRAAMDRAWRGASARQLGYAEAGGEPALRAAIADHLRAFRGLPVTPAQVLVTAGTQAALDLVARVFADPGDCAWVENPGYVTGRAALTLAGLALQPQPVDAEGMAPTPSDWEKHPPRLMLLTPSHQFPSGRVMSLARRLALLEGALREQAWIVEDDYGCEYYSQPLLPPLFGLRPGVPVLYVGGFSKTLYPGLRLGYLVVPEPLAARVGQIARQATRPGQGIEQLALADFLRRGDYIRHLRRLRTLYADRREVLVEALRQFLGQAVTIEGSAAGLHLALRMHDIVSDKPLAAAARAAGLVCRPLSEFAAPPTGDRGLVLGFGGVGTAAIPAAVERLAAALRSAAAGGAVEQMFQSGA